MHVMPGTFGSSSQRPVWVLAQRPAVTAGQALPPGSSGRPTLCSSSARCAFVSQTVCCARTSAASPSIMCASTWQCTRKSPRSLYSVADLGRCFLGCVCSMCSGRRSTGGVVVSSTKDSAGPMLRMSIVSSANTHRCACAWKLCHAMPRSRLKTYQRIFWPVWATTVGVLPMNERPLKQNDGRLAPPASITLCVVAGLVFVHLTVPFSPITTFVLENVLAGVAFTFSNAEPPGCTVTRPDIAGPCTPQ